MKNKPSEKNNDSFETKEDRLIKTALSHLKDLKIPPSLRQSNLKHINEALPETGERSTNKGIFWWHKRISIPLPIAAGFLLVFCLQLIVQSFNLTTHFKASEITTISNKKQSSIGPSEKPSEPYYSEHGVYVTGIGFVEKSKSYDYFKENDYETKL